MLRLQRCIGKSQTILPVRRLATIKFNENFDGHKPAPKPKLSQFKYPLFHTFLIASTTYMVLNTCWLWLEYKEVEENLKAKSKALEDEMNTALEEAKADLIEHAPRRSWWRFWRRS